jgi:cytidine deaminase
MSIQNLKTTEIAALKENAIQSSKYSHSPYSNYPVGAAVMCEEGKIFTGCNVESSSYGLSVCAERNAITSAVANGCKKFRALGIYSKNGAAPCGACRQVIWDICGNIPVYIFDGNGHTAAYQMSELFPQPFDKSNLTTEGNVVGGH